MSSKHRIGLVGAGLMGHGIAASLLRHGQSLTILEHPGNQPLDDLVSAGAGISSSASALAAQVDAVVLCVTGTLQVEAVLTGEHGVLHGLRPGAVVIDCSTAVPASTERMALAVAGAGGRFMDAAMTRTPREAVQGRLNLLVGADAGVLEECRPLLECFAEHITHVGPVGAGHRMKLLHNFVSLGSVALIAEAAACALRSGMDPQVFIDVLTRGGGAGVALERLAPFLLQQDPSGLRFGMGNAAKDLGYYLDMAAGGGAVTDIAAGVSRTFAEAVAREGGEVPVPELVRMLAQ